MRIVNRVEDIRRLLKEDELFYPSGSLVFIGTVLDSFLQEGQGIVGIISGDDGWEAVVEDSNYHDAKSQKRQDNIDREVKAVLDYWRQQEEKVNGN